MVGIWEVRVIALVLALLTGYDLQIMHLKRAPKSYPERQLVALN